MIGWILKIRLENVNFNSSSGPNSFGKKLKKYLELSGNKICWSDYDSVLCFIETNNPFAGKRLFQRLDGIYFNTDFDFNNQNKYILKTYKRADGIIFQSNFSKKLVTSFFGPHSNTAVIHNGADTELIKQMEPLKNKVIDNYETVWSAAATWRPHKRLKENIRYFLEHKGSKDCLVIAGRPDYLYKDPNIFYVGDLPYEKLLSLYKRSENFIHLGWLDNCPNVVVDARACGSQIICCSAGGTQEIAGLDATVIEDSWDFKPTRLYDPPTLDFSKKIKNKYDSCYDMRAVAKKYTEFIK